MSINILFHRALFFLCLLSFFPSVGQHPVFSKVAFPEGVSLPAIKAIVQDQQGFIWLASSTGLHRYDGYNFVSYFNDPQDNHSLAANNLETVFVSKNGTLWVGTSTNGLDRLDPLANTITHFVHDPKDPASLSNNKITAILEDRQGTLWVGTHGGLHRFHPDSGTFTRYQHNPPDSSSLSNDQVRVLYEDRQGTLWVGTGSLWESKPGEGGLNRFNPHKGTFTRYLHEPQNPGTLIDNKVKAIFEDSRGTFWVGTLGDGLHTMDREKGTFIRHRLDPLQPDKLSRSPIVSGPRSNVDAVSFVHEDVTGAIWIGTLGSGLSRYDPQTDKVTHYLHHPKKSIGLQAAYLWCAYTSKEGVLWIGSLINGEGLYRMDPARGGFDYQPTGAEVWGVYEDVSGKVWTATTKGLRVYEKKNGTYQLNKTQLAFPSSLQKDSVASILEDSQGMIWMGGVQGLWRLDPETNALKLYAHDSKMPTSISKGIAFCLYESRDGSLWVGTIKGEINRMNPQTGTFTRLQDLGSPISALTEDRKGNIWVGRINGLGSLKQNPHTWTYKPYLDNNHLISSIREDASGRVWASSEEYGLYLYEEKKDNFTLYKDKNTGRSIVTAIRGMVHDEQGNLWVGSLRGLAQIDKEGNIVSTYGEEVGLNPGAFSWQAASKGRNGKLFIGDATGFYSFYPEKIKINKHPPQLSLTDFKLFDKSVIPGDNGPLHVPVGKTKEMELSHDQNTFSFDLTAIHFTNPTRNKLFFMLENYDIHWREPAADHTASYFKVSPGKYVFRVKAVSSEGIWSEKALPLFIYPPWWRTWWAYSLYGFLGICLLYGIVQYSLNRERIKHELKIQRLETEKMYEIDHLKSRFFANISHEFRTPLTLILGPLENFILNTTEENPHKQVFRIMQRNAQRLLQLINHLLDLSKLEAGSMKLEIKPLNLIAFLKTMVFSFTGMAERKQIRYHFKYFSEQAVVYFDADKLEKMVTNLLSNAFNFTPVGGSIIVTASLEPADMKAIPHMYSSAGPSSKAAILELKVQDSGIGISKEHLDKIFDRFYQTDNSQTRVQEGTGIGLSLVKELVELHAGEISVESQPEKGSCFTIRLPLLLAGYNEEIITGDSILPNQQLKEPLNQAEDNSVLSPDSAMETAGLEAPLLLVIEDNADVRYFIRESLFPFYQIMEATDGEQGYKQAVQNIPDLILSDIMMPKMDGVELCCKLKTNEKTAHIPIILLTAKASGEDKKVGLETGADDYLIKPFEVSELLVRIKNLIENRRKLRELFSHEIILQPSSVAITSVDEQFLQRAMLIVEAHMADAGFGVEEFSREAAMSRRQLFRKLIALTNYSPGDFIRIMRMKRAAELLSQRAGTIAEIAFMVGFHDPSYFTKSFQKQFGKTPSEFIVAGSVEGNILN